MSVFLFGAGASFGSGSCSPHPPPLGPHLFEKLRALGGVCHDLPPEFVDYFSDGDFERGMGYVLSVDQPKAVAMLREMSSYFSEFEPTSENLYVELLRFLIETKRKFAIATTNYDLLIEQALKILKYRTTHDPVTLFTDTISVFKIHGSCNFLVPPNIQMRKYRSTATYLYSGPVDVEVRIPEVRRFCREQDTLAPAIAMYTRGKEVKCGPEFVRKQLRHWQSLASTTNLNVIIGLRINEWDSHIWGVLKSSPGKLLYVGDREDLKRWKRNTGKKNAIWIGSTFEGALPTIKNEFLQSLN